MRPGRRLCSKRLSGLVMVLVAVCAMVAWGEEGHPVRLSVNCLVEGRPAPEIQDRITADISKEPQVEVLERSRINLLLQEGETVQNPERRAQLGRFLSLDYFLNLRQMGEAMPGTTAWSVEAVNAQSGQVVVGCSVVVKGQADPVEALSAGARQLIRRSLVGKPVAEKSGIAGTRVAVLDFLPPPGGDSRETGQALRLSADVRTFLAGGGMTVLDRALAQQVARENSYLQEGFVEDNLARFPLLGADLVVTGKLERKGKEGWLELTLVNAKEARVIAAKRFVYDSGKEAGSLPQEARQWLVETLHPARSAERTFEETIQIEALEPFYQGIAKFFAGQFVEASDAFQKAYTFNDKFGDAMLWEARCYDALGLGPLADAQRRFVKVGLVGRGITGSGKACPGDAITFLGVTSADGFDERFLAETVEMLAINRLALNESRLQLASHLAPLRDEYDVLVGTRNTLGTRWTQTPSFFSSRSLRGALGSADGGSSRSITWFLVDTLSGITVSQTQTQLAKNPADWKKQVSEGIAELLKTSGTAAPNPAPAVVPAAPLAELEKQLSSRKGSAANGPLLQLALADPNNKCLVGRTLSKGAAGRSEQDSFLNFAFRDYLIAHMSAQNPNRAWLELQRLFTFLPYDQSGAYLSGQKLDARAALTDFVAAHPRDLPGCLAQYMVLYDQLGDLPPETLADRLTQLETLIGAFSDAEVDGLRELRGMTRALRITAQIATGNNAMEKLPTDIFAQRLRIEFERDGKPRLRRKWPTWFTDSWQNVSTAAANRVEEARASLAILGRGDDFRRINPQWLTDYPTSCGMMFFVISGLHEVNHGYGKPFVYEFDAAAERDKFRKMTAYAHRNLLRQLDLAPNTHDVNYLEDWVNQFVENLTEPAYTTTVPDQEWETMRQALVEHLDAANARVGRSKNPSSHWRLMSRRPPDANDPNREAILNREWPERLGVIQEERRVGDVAWANAPATHREWANLVHSWHFEKHFNAREKAQMYLRYFPRLKTLYPDPDLSSAELCFFHDFGMTLLQGGEVAAAEAVFERMLEAEDNDLNSFGSAAELRANAALNLAWNYRAAGRKAEALESARRAVKMSLRCEKPFHIFWRINGPQDQVDRSEKADDLGSNLRSVALRLISELRNESQTAPLPPRVKAVVVHTATVDNADVTFYYRVPEKLDPTKPTPVLLICPSYSEGALDYCMDGNAWAQFADSQGIVLCVPQFVPETRGSDFPAFADFHDAKIWSGKATLDALEKIGAQYNIDARRLLIYGYGGGAQFVQHFSRFAPERCAALSMHSASNWLWKEGEAGAKPLSRLKNVPCMVTTGAEDNFGCEEWNRLATAIQWVTMARGEGIPVLWKAWPGVAHQHAPDLDKMCMAFFANCLHPGKGEAPFVGDLRTSVYYAAGDPRLEKIPENFQQSLPTQELAKLWGSRAE